MILIGFFLWIFLGYLLADCFCPQMSRYLKSGLSILLGGGTISVILFTGFSLSMQLTGNAVLISLVIIILIILVMRKVFSRRASPHSSFMRDISRLEAGVFFIIMILFGFSLVFSIYYPVIITDGNDYEAAGRLIAIEKRIDTSTYFRPQTPLVPMLYTYFSILGERHRQLIFPFMYLSLIVCFYFCLLSLEAERKVTALFTLILSTTPFLWWHSFLGLLNLSAGVFFSVATFFWYLYLCKGKEGEKGALFLSSVLYAFAIWSRLELLLYFTIPLLILCFDERAVNKKIISFLLPPMLLSGLWITFYHLRFQVDDFVGYKGILAWVFVLALLMVSAILLWLKERITIKIFKVGGVFFFLVGLIILMFNSDLCIGLKTRVMETLLQPIFWASSSALFVLFFLERLPYLYARKYLLAFIIGYLVFHIILHTLYGKSKLFGMDFMEIVRYYISSPGSRINATSSRECLAFYPILIFYFALSERINNVFGLKKTFSMRDSGYSGVIKIWIFLIVVGNIMVLSYVFLYSRLDFMVKHWGVSEREILLSEGPADNPNMEHLRKIYKLMYFIKDHTEEESTVYFVKPHFSQAEAYKILLPRGVKFIDGGQGEKLLKVDQRLYEGTSYLAFKKENVPELAKGRKIEWNDEGWGICKVW